MQAEVPKGAEAHETALARGKRTTADCLHWPQLTTRRLRGDRLQENATTPPGPGGMLAGHRRSDVDHREVECGEAAVREAACVAATTQHMAPAWCTATLAQSREEWYFEAADWWMEF